MIKQFFAAIMAIACLCGAGIGHTATDDNFYKGKTIRLIVAFSAGVGYDAYSRSIGRHLSKHIVSWEEAEGVVQGLFNIEPAFIARMKQVLVP